MLLQAPREPKVLGPAAVALQVAVVVGLGVLPVALNGGPKLWSIGTPLYDFCLHHAGVEPGVVVLCEGVHAVGVWR